ncbi:RNA polymerase sigma factor [Acanthopleuribacter pedis]|uniref:Sigma-70 family RNA polymerase sigma factor n=1 Tax=Acanthopleuribacter pedis TaxID=442870 RepID=A0A8J7Q421_9BACT|nr:sigma-70 family RNA polymerase sigma factor [Acanthopleuribacter pedis]MBO1317667.1 sigma-70 family RNA polymerase sigma factor [Acanthopleuribacter pedis]
MEIQDEQLVQLVRSGSLDAFDQLMRRYQRTVHQIACSVSGDYEHGLDISQSVFLKAYQKLDTLADPARFKTWLIRMTYHESIDWLRRKREGEFFDESQHVDHGASDGESALEQQLRQEQISQLLGRLHPKHRLAVVLKYFEGCSIRDIAGTLECSEPVVKNMLYRSLKRMATHAG